MKAKLVSMVLGASLMLLCSCDRAPARNAPQIRAGQPTEDTASFAILTWDTTGAFPFTQAHHPAILSDREFALTDSLLLACADAYTRGLSPERRSAYGTDIHQGRYKRQYLAAVNERGEKIVWVNFFCKEAPDWRTKIITVEDGGNCYFQIKVNLTTGRCFEFLVNGYA